jgi:hypothetical protein
VAESPRYTIVKAKSPRGADLGLLYSKLRRRFSDASADERDGLPPTKADAESLIAAGRELLD